MAANLGISDLIAAELSNAAYPGNGPPLGWVASSAYSQTSADGANSFTTFVDTTTKQIVIAFKGSDNGSNWVSDLTNNGGSAWESIEFQFEAVISAIEADPTLAGYQIMTDGHSLGGGMAQTAALEFGLSGYGQNSLPVSNTAITTDAQITSLGGFANALAIWQAAGNTFQETNDSGDPATIYYTGLNYISTTVTTLENPYAALELTGVLSEDFVLTAIGAYLSHSINTVIQLELNDTNTGDSAAIDAFLASDSSTVDSSIANDPLTVSSTGAITGAAPNGQSFTASLVSDGTDTDTYAVSVNGQPDQTDIVTTNGSAITINTEIDNGATVEIPSGSAVNGVTQNFTFLGSSGVLQIDSLSTFAGTIFNFTSGNVIDLDGISATSATLGTGNVLTVLSGGGSVALNFDPTQGFGSDNFYVKPDGNGGTDIILNLPPVTTVPGSETVVAGMATTISGISVADADAVSSNKTFNVVLTDSGGLLSAQLAGTGTVSGSNTDSLTLTGNLADINSELASLTYTGSETATSDTINIATSDGRGGSNDQKISVNSDPINYLDNVSVSGLASGTADVLVNGLFQVENIVDSPFSLNLAINLAGATPGPSGWAPGLYVSYLNMTGSATVGSTTISLSPSDSDYEGGGLAAVANDDPSFELWGQQQYYYTQFPEFYNNASVSIPDSLLGGAELNPVNYDNLPQDNGILVAISQSELFSNAEIDALNVDSDSVTSLNTTIGRQVSGGLSVATFVSDESTTGVAIGGSVISDIASNIEAGLLKLQAHMGQINAIVASDAAVSVSVAEAITYQNILEMIVGGFAVSDTAANIGAYFDYLEADASNIQSISFTDTGTPVLKLTEAQATKDANLLADIKGSYDLVITGQVANDFTGDGASDLLLENTTGAVAVGAIGGNGQESYTQVAALGPEWSFQGNGDFLGNGQDQFLIENTSGAVDVGNVVNSQAQYTQVAALGPEWTFQGAGDFLGNGQDQFLIENTSGAVDVGNVVNGQAQYTQVAALGPEWTFQGTGDFLGNGQDQFLIENTSGGVDVGNVVNGQAQYTQVAALGPEWTFEGTGDFLGNGQDQFLIENTSGAVDVGNVVNGQVQYTQVAALGPEWSFIGTGDYQGTGTAGFMIENTAGAVALGTISNGQASYSQVGALGPEWSSHSSHA